MVNRLAATLKNLHRAAFFRGQLGHEVVQDHHGDESRAPAGDQKTVGIQEAKGQGLEPAVASKRFLHGIPRSSELRWIEDDKSKALLGLAQLVELVKHIPTDEGYIGEVIDPGVDAGQIQRR